ncbi:MAG: hypothetical protein HY673_24335 [Chloroflexi bacterium]|nr:hypothetical protein [Chloroflexota bacterium]
MSSPSMPAGPGASAPVAIRDVPPDLKVLLLTPGNRNEVKAKIASWLAGP